MAEVGGGDREGEHPLLNGLVLSQLFKHVKDIENLTNCRVVCKDWYTNCFRPWRSSVGAIRLCNGSNTSSDSPTPGTSNSTQNDNLHLPGWDITEFLQNHISNIAEHNVPENRQYLVHWRERPSSGYILYKMNLKSDCDQALRVYDPVVDPAPPNITNFWQTLGSTITYMHFDHCQFQGDFQYLFEKMVVEMMPNLQSLKVTDCQLQPKKNNEYDSRVQIFDDEPATFQADVKRNPNLKRIQITGQCPMCFCQLLLNSPNLEELVLSTRMDWKVAAYRSRALVKTISHIRPQLEGGGHFPLKKLDLIDVALYTANDWQGDIDFELPLLEELALTLFVRNYDCEENFSVESGDDVRLILHPHLRNHRNTLKILKVFRPPIFSVPGLRPFSMHDMISLKEMYLWGNVVKSLFFMWRMPGLKTLYLDFRCHDHLDKMEALFFGNKVDNGLSVEENRKKFRSLYKPKQPIHTIISSDLAEMGIMEDLERLHLDVPWQTGWVEILRVWMPRLRVLEVVVYPKGFEAICGGGLENLEELVLLYGSWIDDNTLTGLTNGESERNPKNLTALKNLKRFEMKEIICNVDHGRLGDQSVYEGFLKLDNLRSVSICASVKMTDEGEAALKEHVDNVEVIRKHDNNQQRICCRLKKFYGEVLSALFVD